jgi:hypothetical protein
MSMCVLNPIGFSGLRTLDALRKRQSGIGNWNRFEVPEKYHSLSVFIKPVCLVGVQLRIAVLISAGENGTFQTLNDSTKFLFAYRSQVEQSDYHF